MGLKRSLLNACEFRLGQIGAIAFTLLVAVFARAKDEARLEKGTGHF